MTKRKILVQRADRLGDVVFSLPVLEALKNKFPKDEIHMLTSEIGAELLKGFPLVDKVW